MIDRHLINLAIALQDVDDDVPTLQGWGRTAASVMAGGGRLFACGAGTSALQAQHLVAELAEPEDDRPAMAAAALSTRSDVRKDCQPGDMLLCLSATGADEGVLGTAAAASELGMTNWALTGPAPNAVADACAEAVCVDAAVTTTVEEVHLAAIHILVAALNSAVRDVIRASRTVPGEPQRLFRSSQSAA